MNLATMTLNPWGTLTGLRDIQREMNRLFDGGLRSSRSAGFPLVNIHGDAEGAVLTAEIPGVDATSLDISLVKGQLTIRGTIQNGVPEGEDVICHRKERESGSFARTITLPFEVEEDQISAKYEMGVLTIILPRAEKAKPRTIPVIAA